MEKVTKSADELDLAISEKQDFKKELELCGFQDVEISRPNILGRAILKCL